MAEPRVRRSFWVGFGAGVVLATLLLLSVWYVPRKGLAVFRDSFRFHVLYERAHGLRAGDPVVLNDVEIGAVEAVAIRAVPDVGVRAVVTVEVFDDARYRDLLRYDTVYGVGREGLLGRRSIAIDAGGVAPPIEPGAVVVGTAPFDPLVIAADLQATVAELRTLLAGEAPGGPNVRRALRDLEITLRNLRQFSDKLP